MTADTKKTVVFQLLAYLGACFVPVCSGIIWLNSSIVTLKTQVQGISTELVSLEGKIEAVETLKKITVTVDSLSRQVTKQWEIIGNNRDELNKREEIIRTAKSDISAMRTRIRQLEISCESQRSSRLN